MPRWKRAYPIQSQRQIHNLTPQFIAKFACVHLNKFTPVHDSGVVEGVDVPRWVCNDPQKRAVMSKIVTVGLDLAR